MSQDETLRNVKKTFANVKNKICHDYCKYHNRMHFEDLLVEHCAGCPLFKIATDQEPGE